MREVFCKWVESLGRLKNSLKNRYLILRKGNIKLSGSIWVQVKKVVIQHFKCKNVFNVVASQFISPDRYTRCPKCQHRGTKKTHEEFLKDVQKFVYAKDYLFLSKYKTCAFKMLVRHLSCGNEYHVSPVGFLGGNQCPKCQHRSYKKTT